jgi:hypothetical protein
MTIPMPSERAFARPGNNNDWGAIKRTINLIINILRYFLFDNWKYVIDGRDRQFHHFLIMGIYFGNWEGIQFEKKLYLSKGMLGLPFNTSQPFNTMFYPN